MKKEGQNNAPESPGAFSSTESPLQSLLKLYPQNFWTLTTWPLLQACFFWNGFPITWDLDDLKKTDHFPAEPEAQNNMIQRVKTLEKMYRLARQYIKKKLLRHHWIDGKIHVTPIEFANLCAKKKWYPVIRVGRDLEQAARNIAFPIVDLFCTGRLEKSQKSVRQWFRKEFQELALRIDRSHKRRWKRSLTPTEIYNHKDYQRRLKTLKHPETKELSNYAKRVHIREWIPKALPEKLARGCPTTKKE